VSGCLVKRRRERECSGFPPRLPVSLIPPVSRIYPWGCAPVEPHVRIIEVLAYLNGFSAARM
jgi:hypothetical protein